MRGVLKDRLLVFGLMALFLGQLLYFTQFTTLWVLALIYVLAIGLPYPAVLRSLTSRILASLLISFSLIQLMGALQFFIFPNRGFNVLSLLVTLLATAMVLALHRQQAKQKLRLWQKADLGAVIVMLFFILPFVVLCFWKNNPSYIVAFASSQSPDGASHYIAVNEMNGTQHLDYRTVQYYPKGFHLASAIIMQGLDANQRDLSWSMNARVYILTYIIWGSIVAFFVYYLAGYFLKLLMPSKGLPYVLMAICVGPVLALFYLFPFAYEGFLNYYYVCAAILLGLLYLLEYKKDGLNANWYMVANLLLTFGVLMSWGPLLAPFLLLAPLLYVIYDKRQDATLIKELLSKKYLIVIISYLIQLVPIYLHLKYAKLNSQQGLTATGGITIFDFGTTLAGLGLTVYIVYSAKVSPVLKKFAANVLTPLYGLIGLFICIQYFLVGQVRYYAIKTDYLLELILISLSAALLITLLYKTKLGPVHRYLFAPIALGMAFVLLIGISGDPFYLTRSMFKDIRGFNHIAAPGSAIAEYTSLGEKGQLDSTNNAYLYFNSAGQLSGNELITNWVNLMQYATDSTPAAGLCSGVIFSQVTYDAGIPGQQNILKNAVNECITQAFDRHRPYYIVTNKASVGQLQALFGSKVTYLY